VIFISYYAENNKEETNMTSVLACVVSIILGFYLNPANEYTDTKGFMDTCSIGWKTYYIVISMLRIVALPVEIVLGATIMAVGTLVAFLKADSPVHVKFLYKTFLDIYKFSFWKYLDFVMLGRSDKIYKKAFIAAMLVKLDLAVLASI
jgi:hypothetical protein